MKWIKNKKRFILYCTLYVIGYLFFCIIGGINSGIMISDNPVLSQMLIYYGMPVGVRNLSVTMFLWIIISFFLVLFILWQTDLIQQKLNRTALLCLGLNILFACLSRGIVEWIVSGVAEGLITMLIIFIELFAIVAIAIGITYFVQKKRGALNSYEAFSDIMTEDEFEQWQKKRHNRNR